jgi:hypothetical protein
LQSAVDEVWGGSLIVKVLEGNDDDKDYLVGGTAVQSLNDSTLRRRRIQILLKIASEEGESLLCM